MNFKKLADRLEQLSKDDKITFTSKGEVKCEDTEVVTALKEVPIEIKARGYESVMTYLKAFK